ncbi:MAG TPA: hypothetical protein VNW46_11105 [Gemmatimonadaceae bacterium]|jgi:aspartokinase-like uncharacterized kinase|nr:hypothetical protein [Gemmatimonadaceae bacterium]
MPERVHTVIKVGGALLDAPDAFAWIIKELEAVPRDGSVLIVPGGGPFADMVRAVDRKFGLGDSTAHWAAVLAMDQYAWILADKVPRSTVVEDLIVNPPDTLPIFAPYAWLRAHDSLPHSWTVTGDSIAAFIAWSAGARRLLLVKLAPSTDPYFKSATPPDVDLETRIVIAGGLLPWDRAWDNDIP